MTNAATPTTDAHDNSERDGVLNDIGIRWSRFPKPELAALKTNDDLVSQIVAKYGVDKAAARRDVDTLLAGRNLTM